MVPHKPSTPLSGDARGFPPDASSVYRSNSLKAVDDASDCESAQRLLEIDADVALAEVHRTVAVPQHGGEWRKMVAYAGPGVMVAVGYVDPGNWSTGLAAGSQFGYTLLCIILLSSLIAILLQALSLRLGVATGRDLAQTCRDRFPRRVSLALWMVAEAAIVATDLAEVIGSAIALNLLFGLPLVYGVLVTVADVFVLLLLMKFGWRYIEAFVAALMALIGACFIYEVATANPPVEWGDVGLGYLPRGKVLSNNESLYLAVGIMGATVMPHNLFLHSAIIQTRALPTLLGQSAPGTNGGGNGQNFGGSLTSGREDGGIPGRSPPIGSPARPSSLSATGRSAAVAEEVAGVSAVTLDVAVLPQEPLPAKREAVKYGTVDTVLSLFMAFLINSSILIVAAAVFYSSGEKDVAQIQDAYQLLTPAMGKAASTIFAVALLAAGQSATLTCTLAGQIVMEGFVRLHIKPWQRRLLSRALAVVPAATVAALFGERGVAELLTLSQVILSLALPFAVFPLILFSGSRAVMGEFAMPLWAKVLAWSSGLLISGLNVKLLVDTIVGAAT